MVLLMCNYGCKNIGDNLISYVNGLRKVRFCVGLGWDWIFLCSYAQVLICIFFFLNDPATPEIYPFPLPAALPFGSPGSGSPPGPRPLRHSRHGSGSRWLTRCMRRAYGCGFTPARIPPRPEFPGRPPCGRPADAGDRKSTRLNSSHLVISYAVFCLK